MSNETKNIAPLTDPLDAYTDLRGAQKLLAAVNVSINVVTLGNYARNAEIPGARFFVGKLWVVPVASIIDAEGKPLIEQPKVGRKRIQDSAIPAMA